MRRSVSCLIDVMSSSSSAMTGPFDGPPLPHSSQYFPVSGSRNAAGSMAWPDVTASPFVIIAVGCAVNGPSGLSATATPIVLRSYVGLWPEK
ncbi:Uncharacterised protein [Mycobacteroides abscessus]|nr:Uncharacterised protein [Mycobacteroides abscessus]